MKKKFLCALAAVLAVTALGAVAAGCDKEASSVQSGSVQDSESLKSSEIVDGTIGLVIAPIEGGGYAVTDYDGTDTDVVIPNGVTMIAERAFYGCTSLSSVTVPDSVTSIGSGAFECCYKLVEVYNLSSLEIEKGSSNNGYIGYYAKDIYTSLDEKSKLSTDKGGYILYTDGETISLIGYTGDRTELELPKGITEIHTGAFFSCVGLTSVTIPDSVTSIGSRAFGSCIGLTSFVLPDGLKSIGSSAFSACSNLTSIIIPDSVMSIGEGAFDWCDNLTSAIIGNGVTSIGNYAFYKCDSLKSITFKNPHGWSYGYCVNGSDFASSISSDDLSNIEKAAELLTSTYREYPWSRG